MDMLDMATATMVTTWASDLLMLSLRLMLSMVSTATLMLPITEFPSDPALVLMPSPRVLMHPPRDFCPMLDMAMATMVTTWASDLLRLSLRLMLTIVPTATLMPPMPEFPSDPALVLTPSPRDSMPPPRDFCPMDMPDMATATMVTTWASEM